MNQQITEEIEKLAGKIRQSDRVAFNELFRLMYPRLLGFAASYMGDKSTAYDAVQEAFITLWQKRNTIDPNRSLKSLMFMIVRNRCLNISRSRSKIIINSELAERQPSRDDDDTQNAATGLPFNGTVRQWINELPGRQREAFELSRYDGLSHEEIAMVMEISTKTVNNHILSAINQLRKNYQQYKTQNQHPDE